MKSLANKGLTTLLAVFVLATCGETDFAELQLDDLSPEEQVELEVLTDQGSFEIALELTETSSEVATDRGNVRAADGRSLNAQARAAFNDAQDAMREGDNRRALQAARQARRLVARALRAMGGDAALEALIERIEALALTADDDVFADADLVRAELDRIAEDARRLLADGDTLAAAARAILGEQVARHHRGRRDHPDIDVDRARLAVSLAGTAVDLAERLIESDAIPPVTDAVTDVADHRNRWLAHAKKLLQRAERALAAGHLRRAVHFAHHAHWSALKAVILPGVDEEELRAMVEVAENLLEEARAALGDDPTDLELRLFNRAVELLELGIAKLEEGHERGVAAVWRSAVISAWLIG